MPLRDSSPHRRLERPACFLYTKEQVSGLRFELRLDGTQPSVLPLHYRAVVRQTGFEPAHSAWKADMLPLTSLPVWWRR